MVRADWANTARLHYWMTDDDCALIDVFSLLSDISSPFILPPWCIDFGELLIDLASIQSVCLQYVKHLTSQDLKTATLAPDHRAASKQLLCPLKRWFFPKFLIFEGIFGTRAFFNRELVQTSFHFIFTLNPDYSVACTMRGFSLLASQRPPWTVVN